MVVVVKFAVISTRNARASAQAHGQGGKIVVIAGLPGAIVGSKERDEETYVLLDA